MRRDGEGRRPNIVIFMTDQQRGATVLPGNPLKARTPRLDRLRERGVTFGQCFTVSPHCCPSRASFFTGRYPSEHGVWNNVNVANALSRGPRDAVPFWSQDLVAAGYQLGFAGKWHVSNTKNPVSFGWHECRVTSPATGSIGDSDDDQRRQARMAELQRLNGTEADRAGENQSRINGEIVRPGYPRYVHYGTDEDPFQDSDVVAAAADFVSEVDHDQPWVLYVGTLGPHDPYRAPQRFLDQYSLDAMQLPDSFDDPMVDKPGLYRRTRERFDQLTEPEHRDALRHYLALCSYEDELFGRIEDAVADAGALDDTIFVYLSDHGDYAGAHGLWCKGLPSFTDAYRIPVIIGGGPVADRFGGKSCTVPASLADVGPTILDLCGVPAPTMTGLSLVDAIERGALPREELVLATNGNELYGIQRIVLTKRWKLVVNLFDLDELYDLEADPDEMTNLLHEPATIRHRDAGPLAEIPPALTDVVADLYARLWRFGLDHGDNVTDTYILTALATYGPGVTATVRDHTT